eukprot:1188192-Prorocentrum_minimum.AAC.2
MEEERFQLEGALRELLSTIATEPTTAKFLDTCADGHRVHPETAASLVKQFMCVLKEVKAKATSDKGPTSSLNQPQAAAEKADVSKAISAIEDISLVSPRGKFSIYCFEDRFVFRNKTADVELLYKSVSRVLVLEKPKDAQGTCYIMLHLETYVRRTMLTTSSSW